MPKFIPDHGSYLRHALTASGTFTGVKPSGDFTVAPGSSGQSAYSRWTSAGSGLGLFHALSSMFIQPDQRTAVVSHYHIVVPTDATWTLALTSGLGDGDAGTTVDHPDFDYELASGTGPAFGAIDLPLPPGSSVRFTTSALVVADGGSWYCQLYVHASTGRRGTFNM